MSDTEGSVMVDGVDGEGSEESTSESQNQNQENQGGQENQEDNGSSENKGEESKETKAEDESTLQNKDSETAKEGLTEKGTKLAEDPLSRVNQELANARTELEKQRKFMSDPALVKAYLKTFDEDEVQKEEKSQEPEIRLEDVKTTEDLQKYQRQQDQKVDNKIKELDTTIKSVKESQNNAAIAGVIHNDVITVRETYPELDPKADANGKPTNPLYNPVLDQAIGIMYEKMDYDVKSKSFRGATSLKEVADIVMAAANASKKQGSQEANTEIRDKRTGKNISGASKGSVDESKMSASQAIAARMARASRGDRN